MAAIVENVVAASTGKHRPDAPVVPYPADQVVAATAQQARSGSNAQRAWGAIFGTAIDTVDPATDTSAIRARQGARAPTGAASHPVA